MIKISSKPHLDELGFNIHVIKKLKKVIFENKKTLIVYELQITSLVLSLKYLHDFLSPYTLF